MKLSPADQIKVNAIVEALNRRDAIGALAVTTAIVRIYSRQTADEKAIGATREHNGRGFKAWGHDKTGTYYAQYALGATRQKPKGVISPDKWDEEVAKLKAGKSTPIRMINGSYLDKARKIALYYAATQLLEIAQEKAAVREQAALIAAQSAPISYCPTPTSEELEAAFGPACPETVRSPRSPMVFDRPINVSVV